MFTTMINMIGVKAMARINNFGAFLAAGLMSAYVMYGFDTAGSLAEETHDPRRHAPPAIIRALAAAGIAGFHGKSKTPLIPSIVIGVLTIGLLVLNIRNQRAFFVPTSVAIIMFYIAYLCVTGPLLLARLRRRWPTADHGPHFSLGRWGLPANLPVLRGSPAIVLAEHRPVGVVAEGGVAGQLA